MLTQAAVTRCQDTAVVIQDDGTRAEGLTRYPKKTKTENSSLVANVFWLYGLQGLTYLAPLLLVPYLIRVLGADQYGLTVLAQSLAQYFIIATDYGFNYSATKAIAAHRKDSAAISRIFWNVAATKGLLLCAGGVMMLATLAVIPRFTPDRLIYEIAYLAVIGNAIFPQWLFQGMENMRSITIITGLAKLAAALSVFVFVHNSQHALRTVFLLSSGQVLAGLLGAFVGVRRYIRCFVMPRGRDILTTLREGQHLFLTTACISLFTNTNVLLVGFIAGNRQAGYFGVVDKMARATSGLVYPVIQAAYPHTIALLAESKEALLAFLRKLLRYGITISAAAGLSILLLAGRIEHAAYGRDVTTGLTLIRSAAVFPLMATLSAILGTLVLIPFGFDKAQSRFLLAAGLFNLLLASLLISFAGALGGVVSMTITELVVVMGSLAILSRGGIHLFQRRPSVTVN